MHILFLNIIYSLYSEDQIKNYNIPLYCRLISIFTAFKIDSYLIIEVFIGLSLYSNFRGVHEASQPGNKGQCMCKSAME